MTCSGRQPFPDLEIPNRHQHTAKNQDYRPLDEPYGSLKAGLDERVLLNALQKFDAMSDGGVLPGLEPARPMAADAVEPGDFFERFNEGGNPGNAESSTTRRQIVRTGMAGALRPSAGHGSA